MQEYVQKSISTTLPRRLSRVSGGVLNQRPSGSSGGATPVGGELGRSAEVARVGSGVRLRLLGARHLRELLARRAGVLDVLLERLGVPGECRLEAGVDVERDRERDRADHEARDEAEPRALDAEPLRHRLAAVGDQQHRRRGAERVGERQGDRADS